MTDDLWVSWLDETFYTDFVSLVKICQKQTSFYGDNMVDILLLRYVNAFKNSYIILMGCKSCFEILVIKLWTQYILVHISSVQSLIRVWLFGAPWTAVRQASLYITNSQSLLKLMSIESMMPSNHLILWCLLLLLPSVLLSIRFNLAQHSVSQFFTSDG